jgi:translation initiation factor IF-2
MTDSNDQADKTLRGGARKPLSLQRTVESGHVRQNFSHGRSKSVVVEKKKTRKLGAPGSEGAEAGSVAVATIEKVAPVAKVSTPPSQPSQTSSQPQGRTLSSEERAARERALAAARAEDTTRVGDAEAVRFEPVRHAEPQPQIEEPQRGKSEAVVAAASSPVVATPAQAPSPTARDTGPREARDRRDAGPGAAPREGTRPPFQRTQSRPAGGNSYMPREAGRPREIDLPGPVRRGAGAPDATTIEKPVRPQRTVVAREQVEDDDSRKRGPGGVKVARPPVKLADEGRQRQKLTITNFDREAQVRSLASLKRKREKEKLKAMGIQQPREKISREVIIPEAITIQELSNRMAERAVDLIKYLMKQCAMH